MNALVGIIMGSDSDLPVMQEAAKMLDELQVSYELTVVSAHRTPERLVEYATTAQTKGLKVIIAGAGGAAHLPGMTAAMTVLPVIGVPISTKAMKGIDSLLSIAQMPPGIPVATVAVNGAYSPPPYLPYPTKRCGLVFRNSKTYRKRKCLPRLAPLRSLVTRSILKTNNLWTTKSLTHTRAQESTSTSNHRLRR